MVAEEVVIGESVVDVFALVEVLEGKVITEEVVAGMVVIAFVVLVSICAQGRIRC